MTSGDMMRKLAFCVAGLVACGASALELAVRGRAPEYAIVRAADASPSVAYAAEELRDFTERLTGVRLPIVTDEGPLPPKAIILGQNNWTRSMCVASGLSGCKIVGLSDLNKGTQSRGDDGFRLGSLRAVESNRRLRKFPVFREQQQRNAMARKHRMPRRARSKCGK